MTHPLEGEGLWEDDADRAQWTSVRACRLELLRFALDHERWFAGELDDMPALPEQFLTCPHEYGEFSLSSLESNVWATDGCNGCAECKPGHKCHISGEPDACRPPDVT